MGSEAKIGLEIERKYIIKMPDFLEISGKDNYTSSEILQIYLDSEKGETHRIRRRAFSDRVEYTETRKLRIDNMSVTEIEGEITEESFEMLAGKIKNGTMPILKTRHSFTAGGYTYEIDVYGQWSRTAIMEIELTDRDALPEIPPFIKVIREVTGDKSFSNAAMSREFPEEQV